MLKILNKEVKQLVRDVRANNASESKRKNSLDVVKPVGWVGPDLERIINEASR